MLELSLTQWLLFSFAAVALGIAKGGFSGVSLVSVFILVEVFGPKEQLGVALPMLLFGDLCVYPAFRKYGNWQEAIKILLPSLVGMALAVCIIWYISDAVMERVIGVIILSMVGLQIWKMLKPEVVARVAEAQGFTVFAGLAGGVATMLANVAGPINQLYLLSRNIPKMDLIGIGARFFLIINWLKVPIYMLSDELLGFHYFVWTTSP